MYRSRMNCNGRLRELQQRACRGSGSRHGTQLFHRSIEVAVIEVHVSLPENEPLPENPGAMSSSVPSISISRCPLHRDAGVLDASFHQMSGKSKGFRMGASKYRLVGSDPLPRFIQG